MFIAPDGRHIRAPEECYVPRDRVVQEADIARQYHFSDTTQCTLPERGVESARNYKHVAPTARRAVSDIL